MNTTLTNPTNKDSEYKIQKPTVAELENENKERNERDLDNEYIDERHITISLVHNYSNYRKVNMKVLGQKKETIGSCITSCQVLASNAEEVAAYFPALIGVSANNPDFVTRVKAWLSNIQFVINENNFTLNTSFIYRHKRDYLAIKEKEDKINADYDSIDRSSQNTIRKALKRKIDALNALESTKYKYGRPENLEHYLMYRHCLLYHDVAKDIALINSDSSIRFYIKDEQKEAEKQRKLTEERTKAMRNFVELDSTDSKFNSVFVQIALAKNINLNEALLKDRNEKSAIVIEYVNSYPDKFNKLVSDKNIKLKAFIETLIARNELVRSDFNQQISTADGAFIGSNINEAIAWFENPEHKDVRTAYENKLKLF